MVAPNCASVPAVVASPDTAPVLPLTEVTLASVYVVLIDDPFHTPALIVPTEVKLLAVTPAANVAPDRVPAAAVTVISIEPLKATPLILRGVVNVAALPDVFWFKVGKVQLAKLPEDGVPRAGVTNVGEVANTNAPEPVSSVIAAAKLALDGVPRNVATPAPKEVMPVPPLATDRVPVMPVVNGRPVQLVKVPELGVPRAGVTNVGEFDSTTFVVPVLVVTPVPPLATGNVPVTPVVKGNPVPLVNTTADGVPNAGVVNTGLVDNTTLPVPVEVVTPVPPLATESVPVVPATIGNPVALVKVPEDGVPNAPPE